MNFATNILQGLEHWVIPEKINTSLTEEISALRRGEKIVSDPPSDVLINTLTIRGVNFQFPPRARYGYVFCNDPF